MRASRDDRHGGHDLRANETVDGKVTRGADDHQAHGKMPLGVVEVKALLDKDIGVDAFVEAVKIPKKGVAVEAIEGSDL